MVRKLSLFIMCLWPAFAAAQGLPTIETTPTGLQPLDRNDGTAQFNAVGRLDTGAGFCTGTLIATDLVLTAAHCLFNEDGTQRPDGSFVFNAGLRNGEIVASRALQSSFIHPDYQYGDPDTQERIRTDIAVLRLAAPITSGTVRPMAHGGDIGPEGLVDVVSYGQEREDFPSLEQDCEAIGNGGGVMILTCDTVFGSSGSPVMIDTPGGHRIVSVVSAGSDYEGDEVTLAAAVEGSIDQLLRMAGASNPGHTAPVLAQVRNIGEDGGRAATGARFIRP